MRKGDWSSKYIRNHSKAEQGYILEVQVKWVQNGPLRPVIVPTADREEGLTYVWETLGMLGVLAALLTSRHIAVCGRGHVVG
jgi:hypothetical protein